MKLAASIGRSLQAHMQAELRAMERAVVSGTRDAGGASRRSSGGRSEAPGSASGSPAPGEPHWVPSRGKET